MTPSDEAPVSNVAVLRFSIGRAAVDDALASHVASYIELAEMILGLQCQPGQDTPPKAIPITSDILNHDRGKIHSIFETEVGGLPPETDVLLLDLDFFPVPSIRGTAPFSISQAIKAEYIELASDGRNVTFVILQRTLPDLASEEYLELIRLLEKGGAIIVAYDGLFLLPDCCPSTFDSVRFQEIMRGIHGEPIDLLEQKLIRRRGHFQRELDDGETRCMNVFFDGSLCDTELTDLFQQYVSTNYENEPPDIILYDRTISNWVAPPLQAIAREGRIPIFEFGAWKSNKPHLSPEQPTRALFVAPLMHTKRTVEKRVRELMEIMPCNLDLRILSALSTGGDEERFGKRRIEGSRSVDYFLRVKGKVETNQADCQMCRLNIQPKQLDGEDFQMLTTYDFWQMIKEIEGSPTREETNVPEHRREGLGMVPNFPKIIEANGAWIATKIKQSLPEDTRLRFGDIAVLCPEQDGSEVLARYLRSVCGVHVVAIADNDHKDLLKADDLEALISKWQRDEPPWYENFTNVKPNGWIILDEFCSSGSTFSKLARFLERDRGVKPRCFFALVDLGPSTKVEGCQDGRPRLALYEWEATRIEPPLAGTPA